MAKVKARAKNKILSPFNNYWERSNYIIFGVGVGIIILGFLLMAQSPWDNPVSLSISPIVLLIAYLIIFPLSILYKKKNSVETADVPSKD